MADDFDYENEGLEQEVEQPIPRSNDSFEEVANRIRNSKTGKKVEGKVKETAKSAKDKVMNSEAGKAATTGIKNALNNTKYGKVVTKAAEVGKKAKDGTDKVKDGIEKAKQIKDQIVEKVREKVVEYAVNYIAPGLGKVAAKIDKYANALKKKMDQKFKDVTGIDPKKAKRLFIVALLVMPLAFFMFLVISAGAMFVSSEDNFTDLSTIIKKRETLYGKPLIRMNGTGLNFATGLVADDPGIFADDFTKILLKDEDRSSDPEKRDISVKTYLSELTNKEYDDYIPMEDEKSKPEYELKLEQVRKFLLAGRKNFNTIKWNLIKNVGGTLSTTAPKMVYDVEGLGDWISNSNDEKSLKIPDPNQYKPYEGASKDEVLNGYLNKVNLYLQHWVVPHSLNVASQDATFGLDVLNNMQGPIEMSIFELQRLTKTTNTDYYLKTKVRWKTYNYDGSKYVYNASSSNEVGYDSNTSVKWNDINNSSDGTWVSAGGNSLVSQYYQDDNLIANNQFNSNDGSYFTEYSVELIKDSSGEYVRDGIKRSYSSNRAKSSYRHVSEVTYAEGIYNIIKADYKIIDIDESQAPISKDTLLEVSGKETVVEVWDQNIEQIGNLQVEKYRVSYYDPDKDYTPEGNGPNNAPISRIEWFLDFGGGKFKDNMYPKKSDPKIIENLKTKFKFASGTTIDENAILEATKLKYYTYPQLDKDEKKSKIAAGIDIVQGYSYDDLDFGYQQIKKYYDELEKQMLANQGTGSAIDLGDIPLDGFAWPVDYSQSEKLKLIGSLYGVSSSYIGTKNHSGIDIQQHGLSNTTIIATHDGTATVLGSTTSGGYGLYIRIKTDDGKFTTLYGHMSKVLISNGKVIRGQPIGIMGTTGNSTGPHLHYEIRNSADQPTDPALYYILDPTYTFQDSRSKPSNTYKYVGSISSGLHNSAPVGGISEADVAAVRAKLNFSYITNADQRKAIEFIAPYAILMRKKYGVLPSILISQAINEGGWENLRNYADIAAGLKPASVARSVFGITKSGEGSGYRDATGKMMEEVTLYGKQVSGAPGYHQLYARSVTVSRDNTISEKEKYKLVANIIAQAGWCASVMDGGVKKVGQEARDIYESRLESTVVSSQLWKFDEFDINSVTLESSKPADVGSTPTNKIADGKRDHERVKWISNNQLTGNELDKKGSYSYSNGKFTYSSPGGASGSISVKMVQMTVNTWDKSKKSVTRSFTVNEKLVPVLTQIYKEIYEHPSKPVIYEIGGYRNSDAFPNHPYGTAVDMNVYENPMIGVTNGKYNPSDPNQLSFHENHPVVQIFRKYGWAWGGAFQDYMHFSFLGG